MTTAMRNTLTDALQFGLFGDATEVSVAPKKRIRVQNQPAKQVVKKEAKSIKSQSYARDSGQASIYENGDENNRLNALLMCGATTHEEKIQTLQQWTGLKSKSLDTLVKSAENKLFFSTDNGPVASVRERLAEFSERVTRMAESALRSDPSLKKVGLARICAQVKDFLLDQQTVDGCYRAVEMAIEQSLLDIKTAPLDHKKFKDGARGAFREAMWFLYRNGEYKNFLLRNGVVDHIQIDPQGEIQTWILQQSGLKVQETVTDGVYSFRLDVADANRGTEADVARAICFFETKQRVLNWPE